MVFGEGLSVFKRFNVGGSRGMLPGKKLNVRISENIILNILADHLHITTPISK